MISEKPDDLSESIGIYQFMRNSWYLKIVTLLTDN